MNRIWAIRLFIIFSLITIAFAQPDDLGAAREVLQSYFISVEKGDTVSIKNIVTTEGWTLPMLGLRPYMGRVGYHLSELSQYKILKEELKEKYVQFFVDDSGFGQKRWFYLVRQDGSWKITPPWKVLTADYNRMETEHFIVFWPNQGSTISSHLDIKPSPLSMQKLENHYDRITKLLKCKVPYKIEYYICSSPKEPDLFCQGVEDIVHEGLASPDGKVCFYVLPCYLHEVTHAIIISARGIFGGQHPIIDDGLATAFQWRVPTITKIPVVLLVKRMIESNSCPSLDSVANNFRAIPSNVTYPISATFVLFLIEKFGEEKFRRLFYHLPAPSTEPTPSFQDTIKAIYGKSLAQLEPFWQEWVLVKAKDAKRTIEDEANEILTVRWQKTKSRYFSVRHKSYDLPTKDDLAKLDSLYVRLCNDFRLKPSPGINWYKCSDFDEIGVIFGRWNRHNGLASAQTIVALNFFSPEQISYFLLDRLNCTYSPLVEGVVSYLGAKEHKKEDSLDLIVRDAIKNDSLIPLLIIPDSIRKLDRKNQELLYNQYGSFSKYLIDKYGLEKFVSLIRNINEQNDLLSKIRVSYNKEFALLEEEWQGKFK